MLRFLFMCCGLLFALKLLASESSLTYIEEMDPGMSPNDERELINDRMEKRVRHQLHEFQVVVPRGLTIE